MKGLPGTVRALLALALLTSACGAARTAVVEAPLDPVTTSAANAGDAGALASAVDPAAAASCQVRLTLTGRIEKSSSGCYLDERISRVPGVLRYPCSGNGLVEADFGAHRYHGRIRGGDVELELSTELDWDDGCRWGTNAVISGTLLSGATTMKHLTWRYRDQVLTGTGCSGTCTAKATLAVSSARGQVTPTPEPDDEPDDD